MSGEYVTYVSDGKLDTDDKIMMFSDGRNVTAGRRSSAARVFFGLLVFILLAVILGFVAHSFSALSSQNQQPISQEHENLTSIVMELQARINNFTEKKEDVPVEKGPCSVGWVEVNRKCYYISGKAVTGTWLRSKEVCENHGGRLVTIKTKTELQVLGMFHYKAWIGLSDRETEGSWVWEDGTGLQPGFWLNEPSKSANSQDCAYLSAIGNKWGFNDNTCNRELSYICEVVG